MLSPGMGTAGAAESAAGTNTAADAIAMMLYLCVMGAKDLRFLIDMKNGKSYRKQ